ncbi:MAG: hypothetical protein Tsb0010_12620 [Parvularculaceae bacterium]
MIRTLIFLVVLAFAAAIAAAVASLSGELILRTPQYEITAPVGLVATLGVIFLILSLLILALIFRIATIPALFRGRRAERHRAQGLEALARGLTAIACEDAREAKAQARKARRLLRDPSLTRLLDAQAAHLSGDAEAAARIYHELLDAPETRMLALRGLHLLAADKGDAPGAEEYAARAFSINPKAGWAFHALQEALLARGAWGELIEALKAAERARLVDAETARRSKAVLLAAQAQASLAAGDPDAERLAAQAAKLAPELTPAALIAARIFSENGQTGRAARALERAWAARPHPAVATAYRSLFSDAEPDKLSQRLRALAAANPEAPESQLLLARLEAESGNWEDARALAAEVIRRSPSAEALSLMAEIVERAHGDRDAAAAWLARALKAPPAGEIGADPDSLIPLTRADWAALARLFGETGRMSPIALARRDGAYADEIEAALQAELSRPAEARDEKSAEARGEAAAAEIEEAPPHPREASGDEVEDEGAENEGAEPAKGAGDAPPLGQLR